MIKKPFTARISLYIAPVIITLFLLGCVTKDWKIEGAEGRNVRILSQKYLKMQPNLAEGSGCAQSEVKTHFLM